MKIGRGVSELWRVENLPLPLTRPIAYTTACTTVQAVITVVETIKTENYGYVRLYDFRPKSVTAGLGCGLACTSAQYVTTAPLRRHMRLEAPH